MRIFIITIMALTIMSCASLKSDIPPDLQSVYDKVNNQMVYDATVPKWTINPIEKDLFGFAYRRGSCSNYVVQYMDELSKLGYKPSQMRLMYGHVYLKVIMPNGDEYLLDSAKRQIHKIGE